MIFLYLFLAFAVGFLLAWILRNPKQNGNDQNTEVLQKIAVLESEKNSEKNNAMALKVQLESLQNRIQQVSSESAAKDARLEAEVNNKASLKESLLLFENKVDELTKSNNLLENQKSHLTAELKFKNEQLETQKLELDKLGKAFEAEFKVLAQSILEEKTKTFDAHQKKSLTDVLTPLKEGIAEFKTEITSRYNSETQERISLIEQIKLIRDTNLQLSEQANNLTNALRGQVKQQGNWGEMILESVLEYSGLQKDIHYFVQERLVDEEGKASLPDVIVKYPDGRSIIIDSKVSLLSYEEYFNTNDPEIKIKSMENLLTSFYAHIVSLSGKEYQQKVESLDFVMMFVPVEGAYIAAMQFDGNLWKYAYGKKVLLISPTNLIPAMKLVYDLWKKDDINKDAQIIAAKAVKIYEKLAAFVEDFQKVGQQLQRAIVVYSEAEKKLSTGKGNLISQAHQMKSRLKHDQPNRELPGSMTEQAIVEDEMPDD